MSHLRRIVAVLVLTLLGALGAASAALAGTTVGETTFRNPCSSDYLWFDSDYAVASAGTITSFAYATGPGTAGEAPSFGVVRPVGDGTYTVTGTSGTKIITSSAGVETFATDPIDVQAGDVLALWTGDVDLDGCINAYAAGSAGVQSEPTAPQIGEVVADQYGGTYDGLNVSAHVTDPGNEALVVSTAGTGGGTVVDDGEAIDCGTDKVNHADCIEDYPGSEEPASVTLTATADEGSTFDGFTGGGCTGTDPCTVTLDQLRDVTATFSSQQPATVPVSVTLAGFGTGQVSDGGGQFTCSDSDGTQDDCTGQYAPGSEVTLTASPDEGSSFGGFSGVTCQQEDPTASKQCTFTVAEDGDDVTATFDQVAATVPVTVTFAGTGSGSVSDGEGGQLTCASSDDGDCDGSFAPGSQVTLTATADVGSSLTGFSGVTCDEDAPALKRSATSEQQCTFTVGADGDDVTVTFDVDGATSQPVTVTLAGSGSGTVSDSTDGTGGIDCSHHEDADCDEYYEPGTQVTLYASPDPGSTFAGFSGAACDEDASVEGQRSSTSEQQCTFTVGNEGDDVTATFASPATLTVATTGTGRGYVDSDPSGIDCGRHLPTHTDCSEDYASGTYVTLTAHPQAGTRFDGFDTLCLEDDDRGKAAPAGPRLTCTVRAGDVDTVTAKFTSTGGGSGGGGTFPPTTGDGGTTTGGGTQTGGGGTSTGGGQTPVVKRPKARVVHRRARPHRRLRVTCGTQACSATSTAVLRVRGKKIGSLDLGDAVDLAANAHSTIGLRITRALKAAIRDAHRTHPRAKAKLIIHVVFTQADGTTVKRRIRITIG